MSLRQAGFSVVCVDSSEPGAASAAAGGMVRDVPVRAPWWRARHTAACWDFLRLHCREGIENIFSRHRPEPRLRGGLWLADCASLLRLAQAEKRRVERVEQEARWVVLAAGVWTDALLAASGLPPLGVMQLPGSAVLGSGALEVPLTMGYRLPGDTRTRTATARSWERGLRVGDTVGRDDQLPVLRALLAHVGGRETGVVSGLRPCLPQLFVEKVRPGLIVATGGHRTGLATAAGVGLRVLELIRAGR